MLLYLGVAATRTCCRHAGCVGLEGAWKMSRNVNVICLSCGGALFMVIAAVYLMFLNSIETPVA